MLRSGRILLPILLSLLSAHAQHSPKEDSATPLPAAYRDRLDSAEQAIVVTTSGWNDLAGTLVRFEKHAGKWRQVSKQVPVVVGRSGLGWDALIDRVRESDGPQKKEGDGRSPAGIFSITTLYGFDATRPTSKLPYRAIASDTECVDDSKSRLYNKITARRDIQAPDWNSSEKMRTVDVYRLMAVVDYNNRQMPGAGSCIFLHIWSGPELGTAGCTAMDANDLRAVVDWLDPKKHPVLIQFPSSIYRELEEPWYLPSLPLTGQP
jgi:D-alanyl-D-alanine dipeptidase